MLDVQSDVLGLPAKVVVPMIPLAEGPTPITVLEPVLEVDGTEYLVQTAMMTAVPGKSLGEPIADLAEHEYEIRRALDLVLSGF